MFARFTWWSFLVFTRHTPFKFAEKIPTKNRDYEVFIFLTLNVLQKQPFYATWLWPLKISFVAPYTKFGFVNWVDNVIGNRKEFQSELIIRPDEGLTLKPNYVVMLPRRRSTTAFRNLPPIYEIVGYRKGRRDKRFRTCRVFYVFYRNDGELHSKLYDWMFIWFVNFAFIFFWNCSICNILTIPGTSKTQIPRLFSHT